MMLRKIKMMPNDDSEKSSKIIILKYKHYFIYWIENIKIRAIGNQESCYGNREMELVSSVL